MKLTRRSLVLFALVIVIIGIPPALFPARPIHAQSSPDMEQSILSALNHWRIDQGLWPYRRNTTLDVLALEQASYLQSLGDALPFDRIHDGPDGSDPSARARRAGWPTYGQNAFTAITEIAKVGPDAKDALTFWTTSSVHLRSISNPTYREIGIASVPHEFGFITIVLLGARPDVLPALVDASTNTLYLSNERYQGASGFTYLADAPLIRLFDASGRPLEDQWIDWTATIPLPVDIGSQLVVAYTDGTRQTVALVDLTRDRIDGPADGSSSSVSNSAAAVTSAVNAVQTVAAITPIPSSNSDAQPAIAPSPTPQPTATPIPPARPDIRIVYDARSLAIISLTDVRQNWSGLLLVQGDNRLAVVRWNNLGGFPMTSVPARACIQALDPALVAYAGPPSGCTSYYAAVQITENGRFWAKDAFTVQFNDQTLGTCPAQSGSCEFDLP